ncbi:MAG: ammonium transporter [Actinomycetota bacterium]|nr:ammonium transporter [Actinomycetota bacterium]
MVASIISVADALVGAAPTPQEIADKLTLDSQILSEQFYYWTVVVMWLIHVGFMAYEAGVGRRKNVMATAMKNILTIAVVTPTFYYFGWWIYGCFNKGIIPFTPDGAGNSASEKLMGAFCSTTYPWAANFGPNLTDHLSGVFWAAFLLFSWTTASIMSGALIERVRLSAYLVLACILGSVIWILDAAWGWSAYGFLNMRWGFHDSIAGLVVHGVAGAFTLGVLLNLGPRIGKYTHDGLARTFRPHNLHITLMGLMLIFTGFYAFYAACLVIQSTTPPGWGNIYLNPTTLSSITFAITLGFAGGFTGGYFASRGDPFWTLSGGLAGVISVSAGADIYAPSLDYLIATFGGALAVFAGGLIEKKLRIDDAVGAVAVHGVAGFWSPLAVGLFAAGYPTGLNNVDTSLNAQLYAMMIFLPLGFFGGYIPSWIMKKFNLLRVPPEVELEGLDMAEFNADFYPEHARAPEIIVEPDGTEVPGAPVLLESYRELVANGNGAGRAREPAGDRG